MLRDRHVMIPLRGFSGKPNMASALAGWEVAELAETLGEILATEISRQLHTAINSSLTKCSRMIPGRSASS